MSRNCQLRISQRNTQHQIGEFRPNSRIKPRMYVMCSTMKNCILLAWTSVMKITAVARGFKFIIMIT